MFSESYCWEVHRAHAGQPHHKFTGTTYLNTWVKKGMIRVKNVPNPGTKNNDQRQGHFCSNYFKIFTLNSNAPTPIPPAAPDPAKPIKCSLPILLANSDAPT